MLNVARSSKLSICQTSIVAHLREYTVHIGFHMVVLRQNRLEIEISIGRLNYYSRNIFCLENCMD
jgi:hypothetical protein